jgi:lipopolysaccharide export system permease protein
MKILDWYILKRYLATFIGMLLLFIPIAITVHLAEKIGKILESEATGGEIAQYFLDFTIYFAHLLFPLFLFLSVIWFTSKLANNTEVVAFLSSGVSFSRFLRPYVYGAFIVAGFSVLLGLYLAPNASKGFNNFKYKYLSKNKAVESGNVMKQINENEIIYVSSFDTKKNIGYNFSLEHFEKGKMTHKISATTIRYIEEDSTYLLRSYFMRKIGENNDVFVKERKKDTIFDFDLQDLTPANYIAETLSYGDLVNFIDREEKRGSKNISRYKLELYRKWSLPVSVFILTIIAVSVSSIKRRGGMGTNLAFGIGVAMIYVFFDKIFGTLAAQSDFSPLIAVWFPNFIFSILAIFLLKNAKR